MKSNIGELRKYLLILLSLVVVLSLIIFFACREFKSIGASTTTINNSFSYESKKDTLEQLYREMKNLLFSAIPNRENETVFSVTAADFIYDYNFLYFTDHNKDFLPPMDEWENFSYSSTPHTAHETVRYFFRQYPELHSEPTLSIYVPQNSDYVQKITLDFDDHGYTDWGYQRYSEEFMYVIKILFPNTANNLISNLFNEIFRSAYSDACYVSIEKGEVIQPKIVYYKNSVGIYPYYASGMVHICIIPFTHEYMEELISKGCEIHELEL